MSENKSATLHHIGLSVKDLRASLKFYDVVISLMEWKGRRSEKSTAYSNGQYEIYLEEAKEPDKSFHRYGIGLQHLAFNAPSREAVDRLYQVFQEIRHC